MISIVDYCNALSFKPALVIKAIEEIICFDKGSLAEWVDGICFMNKRLMIAVTTKIDTSKIYLVLDYMDRVESEVKDRFNTMVQLKIENAVARVNNQLAIEMAHSERLHKQADIYYKQLSRLESKKTTAECVKEANASERQAWNDRCNEREDVLVARANIQSLEQKEKILLASSGISYQSREFLAIGKN
ncbi:hypothetical protein [Escherichia phage e4/1c]|uniref:Uncharacterized protein n=1 Tax=Escherichia phage e4/1c TaxID=1495286 RepID=A0A023ZVG8_9CAUD|nr:hypothetical protein e41c_0030 [Escherichia phage e4/1c]AHY83180.1 hypothetical protein [Escherichia phage e4/1c]